MKLSMTVRCRKGMLTKGDLIISNRRCAECSVGLATTRSYRRTRLAVSYGRNKRVLLKFVSLVPSGACVKRKLEASLMRGLGKVDPGFVHFPKNYVIRKAAPSATVEFQSAMNPT